MSIHISNNLGQMAYNVPGIRRFFAPDKEKCEAFLRAQKKCGGVRRGNGVAMT